MHRQPAHGFPGGPPLPPYGESRSAVSRDVDPLGPTVSETTPPPSPPLAESVEAASTDRKPVRVSRAVGVFVAASVTIAVVAAAVLARTDSGTDSATVVTASTAPQPTPTVPPAPPATIGNRTFAIAPVNECTSMLSSIGAGNDFVPAAAYDPTTGPQLTATGRYTTPTWVVELPETVQRQQVVADPLPPMPGLLQGVSDGHFVLFHPLDIAGGSRVGAYRLGSGELVWTAALAPQVLPIVDASRVYLLDRRDPTATRIAVIAPSLGQVVGCFAAGGTPAPAVETVHVTGHAGSLFVSFEGANGPVVEVLSDTSVRSLQVQSSAVPRVFGILTPTQPSDGSPVLLLEAIASGTQSLTGIDTATGATTFTVTVDDLASAPPLPAWGSTNATARIAAASSTVSGISNVLVGADTALVALAAGDAALRMVAVGADGTPLWSIGTTRGVEQSWAYSNGTFHLTSMERPVNSDPPSVAVLDATTGRELVAVDQLRDMPGMGSSLLAYALFTETTPLVVYDGPDRVGTVAGAASSISPVAVNEQGLIVYCESGGRKFMVAYVLDPGAADGPES